MATTHSTIIVKLVICAFVLVNFTGCYEVVSHQLDMRKLVGRIENEAMVVDPHIHENFPRGELGFVVYMNPKIAQKIDAPSSIEFTKLLNDKLKQEELKVGYKICPNGYEAGAKPFVGEYHIWFADYRCN